MTQLTGSLKQIAWAEQIRAEKLAQLDDMLTTSRRAMEQAGVTPAVIEERLASIAPFVARIRETASAAWWIDHRNELPSDIIKAMYKEAMSK
jgi:hypothetical protein